MNLKEYLESDEQDTYLEADSEEKSRRLRMQIQCMEHFINNDVNGTLYQSSVFYLLDGLGYGFYGTKDEYYLHKSPYWFDTDITLSNSIWIGHHLMNVDSIMWHLFKDTSDNEVYRFNIGGNKVEAYIEHPLKAVYVNGTVNGLRMDCVQCARSLMFRFNHKKLVQEYDRRKKETD